MAWLSTLGFHCGSTIKMRFAEVRFKLFSVSVLDVLGRVLCCCCQKEITTYPKAPVPVVMMSTGVFWLLAKSSRIFCRRGR